MRKRPLFLGACVFLMGLFCERFQTLELLIVLLGFLGVEILHGRKHRKYKLMAGRSIALLSVFLLGVLHMNHEECFRSAYLSKIKDGDAAVVWGEIYKIEETDYGIRLYLSDCFIRLKNDTYVCNNVLAYPSSTNYHIGETHKISGQINTFSKARNEGNFDSEIFYQSQKIDFAIEVEDSTLLVTEENAISEGVLYFKQQLSQVYESSLSSKAAGFYSAMLLGDKSNLDGNLKKLFTDGGIVHILAVSGLHVSLVGRSLYQFLRKRGLKFLAAGLLGAVTVFLYCYMTGNGMSAQRAAGMLFLFFLAQCIGKSYDMLNALGAVGLVLLWENPFLMEYSGFWFSVMALVGIGFISEEFSWKTKLTKGIWSSLAITLATLPVTAFCYYEIPLYSPGINAIVLPILTPVFALALMGGCIGLSFPGIAKVLLVPCEWMLFLFEKICVWVGDLPVATLITGMPEKSTFMIYYIGLFVGLWLLKHLRKRKLEELKEKESVPIWWIGAKLAICFFCLSVLLFPKTTEFEISFLDVGQGDGIYICMSDGTKMFIDGGSTDVKEVGTYRILPFLKAKQVSEIDYWFVSHADTDHISGLLEVLRENYVVKNLIVAAASPRDELLIELISLVEEKGTNIIYMKKGDTVYGEDWSMHCLFPKQDRIEDKNDASLVLYLKARELSALFAGDISSETETEILEDAKIDGVFLFKAIHHGSKNSNSEAFLQAVRPNIVAISCGEGNRYGHPAKEAIGRMEQAGAELYYTMYGGQIKIYFDEDRVKIKQFLE